MASLSALAQHRQRADIQRSASTEHASATHQQRAYRGQEQQPGVGVPGQIEGVAVEQEADQFATDGCQQAADCPKQGELGPPRLDQQFALGTQRAEQGALADALVQGGLQAGEQHGQTGGEDEQQDEFDGQSDLGHDAAQLREQGFDLQQGDRGKGPRQFDQASFLLGGEVEAGQVGDRQILQGAGFEDHVEVGLEAVPVDFAQVADPGVAVEAADIETQAVAQFELQAFGQLRLHRDARQVVGGGRAPPSAGEQLIALGQVGRPGQAEITANGLPE